MKAMDSFGDPNQQEGNLTLADLEVRNVECQIIPSQQAVRPDRPSGFTHCVASSIEKEYSESDPLLPNGRRWSSAASGAVLQQCEEQQLVCGPVMPNESLCAMVLQILVPFLLAGLGTVMAGMLLDVVQVRRLWGGKNTFSK